MRLSTTTFETVVIEEGDNDLEWRASDDASPNWRIRSLQFGKLLLPPNHPIIHVMFVFQRGFSALFHSLVLEALHFRSR
jgi:hypothetical protein